MKILLEIFYPKKLGGYVVEKPDLESIVDRKGFMKATGYFSSERKASKVLYDFVKRNWGLFLPVSGPCRGYPAFASIRPGKAADLFFAAFDDDGFGSSITEVK